MSNNVIVKDGWLVLQPDDPIAVRSLLPQARTIEVKGQELIVVPHQLDTTQVLRNIGILAPSPINYGWQYTGKYTPFKHQRITCDFLTLTRRGFNLSEMGCVDSETEYLSPSGWKKISDYAGGEVGQYHPETGEVEFVLPDEYVKLPCDTMVRIKTKYGLDQLLSPEHRVLLQTRIDTRTEVVSAGELLSRQNNWLKGHFSRVPGKIGYGHACIPVTFSAPSGDGIPLTDAQLRVQIAVIADGHFPKQNSVCVVRVKKERKKQRLRRLLNEAGINFVERSKDFPTAKGFTVFRFIAPIRTKEFTIEFWKATRAQLNLVCDEVLHWDGSVSDRKPTSRFHTNRKDSADFVQYAFAGTGRTARVTRLEQRNHERHAMYEVSIRAEGKPLHLASRNSHSIPRATISLSPSSDGFKYCFVVPSTFLLFRRNGCVFASGNTGKSASAIWSAEYLMQQGLVRRALVIAPLSCLHKVWADEIFRTAMHRVAVVLHGSRDKRRDLYESPAQYLIINHDGLGTISDLVKKDPTIDLVIVDEAAAYRNAQTNRYKLLKGMLRPDMRLWLMTGTPCPSAPTDAWSLARLVRPENVPPYFTSFKRAVMDQVTQFKWVPRPDAYEKAYAAMQPAVRFLKKDCIDLPPITYQNRECELTEEQRRAYKAMAKHMATEHGGQQITAANAAVKLIKLLQICAGVVLDDTGTPTFLDATPRLSALKEIIEECDRKVIVWVPFKAVLYRIVDELNKTFGQVESEDLLGNSQGRFAEGVCGDTSDKERTRIFSTFQQETGGPKVLVAHPGTAAHGLTLTSANTGVWYGPFFSAELYLQANERYNRPGQKHDMSVIHLGATPVEWGAYDVIRDKTGRQQKILDLYQNLLT